MIPLPDKPVHKLNKREMSVFRKWIGFEDGADVISYPTPEEKAHRRKREQWKRRYAGKGAAEPQLLVKAEQIRKAKANARRNSSARKWMDDILAQADTLAALPNDFFETFIPDLGPWDISSCFCPACYRIKSPERISWQWDWRDPEHLTCPYCATTFPNAHYPENGELVLPRTGKRYTFHILEAEQNADDWRLGENAKRFVEQPVHESFTGNIRAYKIDWAIEQVEPLSLAYAFTKKRRYSRCIERILSRFADVYGGYLFKSYFQDIVDADPGYANDNADALPTVFKRNACIGVYDGRYGRGGERTTTQTTRVASGLWGCSRISRELFATGKAFTTLFHGYDRVRHTIAPEMQRKIEQNFLLELYLDLTAYEPITNKSGAVRAAQVAFGLVYGSKTEMKRGIEGNDRILSAQFHDDGSMIETPNYGHATIREGVWMIPEMLKGTDADFYTDGKYRAALQTYANIATPLGTQPPIDDCGNGFTVTRRSVEIAQIRCDIQIPNPGGSPSDFAILNGDPGKRLRGRNQGKAHNRFYGGRKLACFGYGSGKNRTQGYLLGEDGRKGHRHAACHNLLLYTHGWDVFPDLGYLANHPGNAWFKATSSHQTVVVDEQSSVPSGPSRLIGWHDTGPARYVDIVSTLEGGITMRRALTLIRKDDGRPILIDLFDVEGGSVRDYNVRANVRPNTLSFSDSSSFRSRRELYKGSSFYPLLDFKSSGKSEGDWSATWGRGDQKLKATVLTPCTERITYRSPGWRNAAEIPAEPGKYFDTLVLRSRKKSSRFLVVYEVCSGSPAISSVACDGMDDTAEVHLQLKGGKRCSVRIPGSLATQREDRWSIRYRSS
jgi:hypothetical protein